MAHCTDCNFLAWNSASVLWIFWSGTSCLIHFVNAIIWHDNVDNVAPVWCDICELVACFLGSILIGGVLASRWIHVESIGIITAGALLNHRLYKLLKLGTAYRLDINVSVFMFSSPLCRRNAETLVEEEHGHVRRLYWARRSHSVHGFVCVLAVILETRG